MLPFSPLTSCRQNVIPQHMYLRPLIGICLLELAVLRIHSVFISNLASDKVNNAGVEYRQKYHPHDIMCVMTWWHLSREVIPRPWSCSVCPGTRAGTRTLPAGSGARTWRRYHTETRSHTGPRSSHAPELFFLCIFCNCLFFWHHLERVQRAPLEVDHGLAVEDESLNSAVQPNDDARLGTDTVQVPETGEQAITLDGILQ